MEARKRWSDIRAAVEPEILEQATRKTAEMLREMPPHELREARRLSHEAPARVSPESGGAEL